MTAPVRFKESDVIRALRGAAKAGFTPAGCKIDPTGSIVLMFSNSPPASSGSSNNPWDVELR